MLCRLCLTRNEVSHCLYEENIRDFSSLAPIVSQWFQIAPNDVVSTVICAYCWQNTLNFHLFCCNVVKAQRDHFNVKDSNFVKPLPHINNTTPLTSVENIDCAVGNTSLECQPKTESLDLNECKVEMENGEDLPYHSDSHLDDNSSNPVSTIKAEELSDLSAESNIPVQKQKKQLRPINRAKHLKQSGDSKEKTSRINKNEGNRVIEHIQTHMNPDSVKHKTIEPTLNDGLQTNSSESFKCDQFPKKYARYSLLTKDKVYGCDTCQKKFLSKSILKRHIMRSHVLEVCEYCGKQFKCKYYLNVHRNEAHMGIEITRLQCHVCGVWMRGSNLSKHVKTHNIKLHPEPHCICSICSRELKNKIVLKRHMKIVHGNREHECTICGKKFGIPLSLKEHMAVHTGEDLYKCRYCTKTFKSNANMHAHRKKAHFKEWKNDRGKRLIDGRYQ